MVKQDLLKTPIIYLSLYINQNKYKYYNLIQDVRDNQNWEEWILFMLDAISKTSYQTIHFIQKMKKLMLDHKNKIRTELPKIYSQDLLNNIFRHPYTTVEATKKDLEIHRNTAVKYLEELVQINILKKQKVGSENFYLNISLLDLLQNNN
jgi:Fic family protein